MSPLEIWLTAVVVALVATAGVGGFLWWRFRVELGRTRAALARATRSQEQVAELAANAERMRIVREMHDVIAHSLAIMIAQADGGSYVTSDAEAAKRAFWTIAETGRAALSDTRRILGVLRHGEAAELTPVPTQASLDELVEQARGAGLEVSLVRLGAPRRIPSPTRLALYRICQEALTNVLKHAGLEARTIVSLSWGPDAVTLTVTDSGPSGHPGTAGEPLAGLGLGLIGMGERAELVGGTLTHRMTEDGFVVQAVLPVVAEVEGEDE